MHDLNLWRRWLIDRNLMPEHGELFASHCAGSTAWIHTELIEKRPKDPLCGAKKQRFNQIP